MASAPETVVVGGVIAQETDAQVQAVAPGNTITPTQTFNFPWNNTIIQFTAGVTAVVDPYLLAALSAAVAPFTQP